VRAQSRDTTFLQGALEPIHDFTLGLVKVLFNNADLFTTARGLDEANELLEVISETFALLRRGRKVKWKRNSKRKRLEGK
jgi:hypothetical protein